VSTVLEIADHALQIKYWYLITKLTSRSLSEWLKKVSCANLDFFVRVRTKYRTFWRTTHNNQLIDRSIDHRNHVRWPPNHRTMATRAIRHHRWCLPLPPSPMRPSILLWGWWNSLHGSTKMERWGVRAALQHKMCSGRGRIVTNRPRHIRIELMGDREGGDRLGDITINCWGRGEGDKTQQYCSEVGGSSKPSKADLAPKHNNKPQ
jgi:hypothetical protein